MAPTTPMPADNGAKPVPRPEGHLVPLFPTLWPHMLLPTRRTQVLPFPFAQAHTRYYYLARYGIYDIARAWELEGREVLFPAYFHSVELDALVAAGVRPRFFPVHRGMRVDADEVARLIGPETAAVYLIHYGGFPGPVQELVSLCRERRVRVIEDAALALLSRLGDQPLGSFGDAAVFCLYKTIPTPTGGAILMREGWPASIQRPRPFPALRAGTGAANSILLNLQMRGMIGSRQVWRLARRLGRLPWGAESQHRLGQGSTFDRRLIGVGVGPFVPRIIPHQDYAAIVERRRRNYLRLNQRLGSVFPPVFRDLPEGVCPLFYPFETTSRRQLLRALGGRGVEIGKFWPEQYPAIPLGAFPEVDELRRSALWLPCHQDLTDEAIDGLASVLLEAASQIE